MADAIYEVLVQGQDAHAISSPAKNRTTAEYLERVSTLSLSSLTTTESEALEHEATSILRSLQALAKRSFKSIDSSVDSLGHVQEALPQLSQHASSLHGAIPDLSRNVSRFSEKYSKAADNPLLERRRKALRLGENVDRLSDILELPTLLSSTIAASASTAAGTGVGSASSANAQYASALDLYAHIRRLQRLFPDSELIRSLGAQAEAAMRGMTTNLVVALRSNTLKLASAMRLIGLLRRVAPELDDAAPSQKSWSSTPTEGSLGALFLVCRLGNLIATLDALEPLRELADQDTAARTSGDGFVSDRYTAGQHTERYLKRYIEIFREQCFAIISMYTSIFPASLQLPTNLADDDSTQQNDNSSIDEATNISTNKSSTSNQNGNATTNKGTKENSEDQINKIPSALSTFTMHLVDTLFATLKRYLPNVIDQSSRDSLLTQVLYCAGSLGRLGGDFGMMLALLEDDVDDDDEVEVGVGLTGLTDVIDGVERTESSGIVTEKKSKDSTEDESKNTTGESKGITIGSLKDASSANPEWVEAMKKHRIQASRLELLASGVGTGKSIGSPSREVASP